MVSSLCSMMKFRIYHGMLVCAALIILLMCWVSLSALLCWLSQTLASDSYLRHLTNRFCPSSVHISGKTVTSFSHEHKTLGLVSKLLKDEYESEMASTLTRISCQQPESLSKTGVTLDAMPISCVPLHPPVKTCHKVNQKEVVCDQKERVVCELKVNSALPTVPDIFCHEICQSQVRIGVFNNTVGHLTWNTVSTITKLQSYILHLINPLVTTQDSSGFCFIQCNLKETNETITQLLVLPPNHNYLNRFKKQDIHRDRQQHSAINFNLVLMEGVTRYGFWNKLPLTIEKLKMIQNSDVTVLDFETVQSSASALLWQQVIGVSEEPVFKTATSNGYQTLWLEDGCYQKSISTNRLVSWMSQASVLDVGPSIAFCEARSWRSQEMPCYNGISWHDYSFKYLRYYKAVLGKFGQPHISVFHSHLGNEHLRVASLDQSLAKEIQYFANQKNTLTVIVSYPTLGGHAYPEYVLHGAPVVFHPVMFIFIPKSIQQFSEQSEFLSNLIVNQNRLVTTLDLYELIKYVISGGHPDQTAHMSSSEHLGLLAQIPVNRSCEVIFLESAASCVCEGYRVPVKTGKHITLLAEYAVSELNAILQSQFDAGMQYLKEIGYQDHVVSTCQRLIGHEVYNVSQALIQNDRVLTEMTVEMKSGVTNSSNVTNHSSHVSAFRVTIEHDAFINTSSLSLAMKLISYKRLDNYVMYEVCTGGLIPVDLCLCQPSFDNIITYPINKTLLNQMSDLKTGQKRFKDVYKYFDPNLLITTVFYQFGSRTITHSLDPNAKEQCLFIVYRMHDLGANFEAVNTCQDHAYELGFSIRGKNLCYSNSLAITHQVAPLTVVHLVTLLQDKADENWFLRYQVQFREFLL